MDGYHKSIFVKEILEFLDVVDGKTYLDLTLGDGGHSLEILKKGGNIVALDVDPEAIERARERFKGAGIDERRYKLIQGNFREIERLVGQEIRFTGAIADLGVSTLQLKKADRGFSLMSEGPLDMRMDPNLSVKAVDLINGLNKGELMELFKNYGEEYQAKKIAEVIIASRPLETTLQLAYLVEKAVGKKTGYTHPATQVFQALRIAVNDEMYVLKEGFPRVINYLEAGARFCVITFHSLEDGVVKNIFKELGDFGVVKILTDKPINPSEEEVFNNLRSRSAKLRIVEKT